MPIVDPLRRFALLLAAPLLAWLLVAPAGAAPIVVPTGLNPGDPYRLVFVTSTGRSAFSSDIADYNAFVTAAANAVPELLALGTTWTAIASTPSVDARDNTGTNPGGGSGDPIYNTNDQLVATGNPDLWDGAIAVPILYDENGNVRSSNVWACTLTDGTGAPGLGSCGGVGRSFESNARWINFGSQSASTQNPLYGISGTLIATPEPGTALLLGAGLLGIAAGGRRNSA